jgi:predicted dehydrogenase
LKEHANLRAGVIGAGAFGRFHAQKYASRPGVELIGVADADLARAREVASSLGATMFADYRHMLPHVDVVTIATPAATHGEIGATCLAAGKHVFMEKPIAATLGEADRLIAVAAAGGLVLHTGHQERFVMRHMGLFAGGVMPLSIESHRANTFNPRNTDVSVVLDLMIHDLDLMHQLNGAPVTQLKARERSLPHSRSDEVAVDLVLADGMNVRLFASRMAETRKRFIRVLYPDGEIFIDFLTREMTNTTPRAFNPPAGAASDAPGSAASPGELPCPSTDPLGYGVAQFLAAVRTRAEPVIRPQEARRALETALSILAAAKEKTLAYAQ